MNARCSDYAATINLDIKHTRIDEGVQVTLETKKSDNLDLVRHSSLKAASKNSTLSIVANRRPSVTFKLHKNSSKNLNQLDD